MHALVKNSAMLAKIVGDEREHLNKQIQTKLRGAIVPPANPASAITRPDTDKTGTVADKYKQNPYYQDERRNMVRVKEPKPFVERKRAELDDGPQHLDELFDKQLLEEEDDEDYNSGLKSPKSALQEIESNRRIEQERERKQLEIQKGIAAEDLRIGFTTQQQEFGSVGGRHLDPLHESVKALDEQHHYEHKYTEYERHQQDLERQRLNQ